MKAISVLLSLVLLMGCAQPAKDASAETEMPKAGGQSSVNDDVSQMAITVFNRGAFDDLLVFGVPYLVD